MTLIQLILVFLILGGAHPGRLLFHKNEGQAAADVRYILDTPAYHLHFKRGEMVFYFGNNAIRIQFAGQLVTRVPAGNARLDGVVRYINSDAGPGTPSVPTFASVKYESLYSGIDLSCFGHGGQLQCDFVTMPEVDPGQIRLDIYGADKIDIDDGGNLNLEVGGQALHINKPTALQVEHGQRDSIDVRYRLTGPHEIGMVVGQYDHSIPLIIDAR